MKQFLYLDMDIVASIIAQSEKGLIVQTTSEQSEEQGKKRKKSDKGRAKASAGGSLLKFLQAEATIEGEKQIEFHQSIHSTTKEIAEKTLHDAAFDIAYNYVKPTQANESESDAGDYISLKRVFTFVDFDYFERLFEAGGVIETIEKLPQTKKINLKDANVMIKLLKGLVPYSRMLISYDGFLVPLDDKYFRIDPSNLGFKYGGEITCVGLITNIIGESTDPGDDKDVFSSIQFSANEILRAILPTRSKDLCVVHPIAIYYEV